MRILHVTPAYLPAYRYGGPIQSVHTLNKSLVRAGAEVTVYTTSINGLGDSEVPLDSPVARDGVQIHYFKPNWMRFWFYAPGMRRALAERVREFDIVHITSVFLSASTLGAQAAQAANIPYLISPRGALMRAPLEKKSPLKKKVYLALRERKNLEAADALHFTTELEKLDYERLGYRMRKAVVIPNALDPEALPPGDPDAFRKKFGIPQEKKIVLFLGRLSWKKGLDTLIPAFAAIAKEMPETALVLAGGDDEDYQAKLDKLIDMTGIRERIVFTGAVHGAERSAAYRSAAAFVLPSYSENFGMTVVEAMRFGVPVIISEEVALASVVRASGAGVVIKKDASMLGAALKDVLGDLTRSRAMGERGASVVTSQFSSDKIAQVFLGAYNEVIGSHRNP